MAFGPARCYLCAVQTPSGIHSRHPWVLCLALAAYLLSAGTPLLHVLAHAHDEDQDDHHASHVAAWEGEHHEEVHPPQLHEKDLAAQPAGPLLALVVPSDAWSLDLPATRSVELFHLVSALRSRAPPPGDPARAPPLV